MKGGGPGGSSSSVSTRQNTNYWGVELTPLRLGTCPRQALGTASSSTQGVGVWVPHGSVPALGRAAVGEASQFSGDTHIQDLTMFKVRFLGAI